MCEHWCQLSVKPVVRQGLKPLPNSESPLKRTNELKSVFLSPLKRTFALRQGIHSLSDYRFYLKLTLLGLLECPYKGLLTASDRQVRSPSLKLRKRTRELVSMEHPQQISPMLLHREQTLATPKNAYRKGRAIAVFLNVPAKNIPDRK